MLRRCLGIVTLSFALVLATGIAQADTFPGRLAVSGALAPGARDTGGGSVDEMRLLFNIEDAAGTTVYFSELHCRVPAVGREKAFSVVLGTIDPLRNPLPDVFDDERWLAVRSCDTRACTGAGSPNPSRCSTTPLIRVRLDPTAFAWRANKAITALNETELNGRAIIVKPANPKSESGPAS